MRASFVRAAINAIWHLPARLPQPLGPTNRQPVGGVRQTAAKRARASFARAAINAIWHLLGSLPRPDGAPLRPASTTQPRPGPLTPP